MSDPIDPIHAAAQALSGECPTRLPALCHRLRQHYHCRVPGSGGRVSCFHHEKEPPVGSEMTEAQAALYAAQESLPLSPDEDQ